MKVIRSAAVLLGFLAATTAYATAQRTFVSVGGSDFDPCSVAKPCRTFAAAVLQTAYGGEVIVLDSGGYGPVVLTQAVSIVAPPGVYAGISVPGAGVGVRVSAGAGDLIVLRGLTMTAQPGGQFGIYVLSGGLVVIEGCETTGHLSRGVLALTDAGTDILVKETHITGADDGILVTNYGGARNKLTVIDSVFNGVVDGIVGQGDLAVVIDNVRMIGRGIALGGTGMYLSPGVNGGSLHASRTLVRDFYNGVWAEGTNPNVSIATSELTLTHTAVQITVPGQVALTSNRLVHNTNMVSALYGAVTSSGTNYAADNGSTGDPITGPSGLF